MVARCDREARIAAQLDHRGIVTVHSSEEWKDHRPFFVMRFVPGPTLAQEIDRVYSNPSSGNELTPRKLRSLIERLKDACQAVAHAHERHIAHLDLKPGNILLGPYGDTVVVDWGSARSFDEPSDPADSPGTPAYMSPEQANNQLDRLDARTDVFNLGATLYHLLTGRAPFGSPSSGQPEDDTPSTSAEFKPRESDQAWQMARTGECIAPAPDRSEH